MRSRHACLASLLFLGVAGLARASCTVSDTTLCLNDGRFSASVTWKDFKARTGVGTAVPITADTGYFWFFSPANVELVIKVLDGRGVNGKYWVFFGALSNVEYTLTVKDTTTGAIKMYVNPSGQFASVGDTKAFDPASIRPTEETVAVEGESAAPASLREVQRFIESSSSAAAEGPSQCPAPRAALFLSGCRFRLEVSWRDPRGRTGDGVAVPLTNDTGYFWFFSEANIELMVKVLDARGISGKFWVFFGALSNVQYTLSVTDQVTGEVRRYENPSGQFASVGDTSAFATGYAVAPVPDDTRASSAVIDETGGTLTAAGADGTQFTLLVPPDALPLATTITMTPLSRVDRLPFSGGLKGGVQLEPNGLFLFEPAVLTIRPPTEIPAARLAPFAYRASGEEFILYPRTVDAGGIHLPVAHFSGYGVGDGTGPEQSDQSHRTPSNSLDRYIQEAADIQSRVARGELDADLGQLQLIDVFARAYTEVILPSLRALTDCNPASMISTLRMAFTFLAQLTSFGEVDLVVTYKMEIYAEVRRIALQCVDEMYRICKENDDLYQIPLMLGLTRTLALAGVFFEEEELYVRRKVEACARFELDFDATFTLESELVFEQGKYVAEKVPIALNVVQGDQHFILRGEGPIRVDFGTFIYKKYPQSLCNVEVQGMDSTFTVHELTWDMVLATQGGPGWQQYNLIARMEYEPGEPAENDHITCPSFPDADTGFFSKFAHNYGLFHTVGEKLPAGYFALGWNVIGGSIFATRDWPTTSIPEPGAVRTGTTHMVIRHTPQ